MTTTKITINDDVDITQEIEKINQPSGMTPLNALRSIIDHYEGRVKIRIASILLPSSYSINPSQLAKYLSLAKVASVQLKDEQFHIVASSEKEPTTFIRRVESKIMRGEEAFFKFENIPVSYRRDPALVGRNLRLAISASTTSNGIKWYITS